MYLITQSLITLRNKHLFVYFYVAYFIEFYKKYLNFFKGFKKKKRIFGKRKRWGRRKQKLYIYTLNCFLTCIFKKTPDKVDEIIDFRKRVGFLKKSDNVKKTIISNYLKSVSRYRFFQKYFSNRKFFYDYGIKKFAKLYSIYGGARKPSYNKSCDLSRNVINTSSKFKLLLGKNRNIIRFFFTMKKSREFAFDRNFVWDFKKNYLNILRLSNYNLFNIFLKAKFVFSREHYIKILLLGIVFLNFTPLIIQNHTDSIVLEQYDIVQLPVSPEMFFFKRRFGRFLASTRKKVAVISKRLSRFNHNIYKQSATSIPRWLNKLIYYNLYLPTFFEVDYTLNMFIVLDNPTKVQHFNWYSYKFINLALLRLYSWKYII